MSTKLSIVAVVTAATFSISPSSLLAQADSTLVTITVNVNTKDINNDNVDEMVILKNGILKSTPGENGGHVTLVYRNGEVVWLGEANEAKSDDKVKILEIRSKGANQPKVLKRDKKARLLFSSKVKAGVSQDLVEDDQEYQIKFKVKRKGASNDIYVLDPKLRMKIR